MKRTDFLLEADELLDRIGDPTLRIFDATILFFRQDTDATAYQRYLDGHLPGAAFFDHDDFSDPHSKFMYMVLDEPDLAAQIGQIGIDHESEVIFYTYDMLPSATRAWWVLRYAGHDNVRVLNGGLDAWKRAGGQIETGPRQYEPTRFRCRLRPEMFVGREDVEAALADGNISTVHTLPPDSYAEAHIPGTTCLPCTELMHEMASFLPEEVLARRLSEDLGRDRIITYCGGGIAATVNGMAHLMAGNKNVAVYDGSLSEWTGEGLPIAHGSEKDGPTGSSE